MGKVLYEELFPDEFAERIKNRLGLDRIGRIL